MYMGKCNGLYSESFTCVSVCRKRLFMLYYVEHLCLKVTVCAYRPWVRDARIVPHGNSIITATGYSFPSGHTMNAATVFGGGAVRKDLPGLLRMVLGITVVLVSFIFPWCLKYLEKPAAQAS